MTSDTISPTSLSRTREPSGFRNLVMTTSRLSSYPFDWRRWTVTVVTDNSQGAILIIPFSAFGNATRAALSAFVPADHVDDNFVRVRSKADIRGALTHVR